MLYAGGVNGSATYDAMSYSTLYSRIRTLQEAACGGEEKGAYGAGWRSTLCQAARVGEAAAHMTMLWLTDILQLFCSHAPTLMPYPPCNVNILQSSASCRSAIPPACLCLCSCRVLTADIKQLGNWQTGSALDSNYLADAVNPDALIQVAGWSTDDRSKAATVWHPRMAMLLYNQFAAGRWPVCKSRSALGHWRTGCNRAPG